MYFYKYLANFRYLYPFMYYVEHKGCFIDYNYIDFSKGNNLINQIIMGIIWDL